MKKYSQEIRYEFECDKCQGLFEMWLTMKAKKPKKCPSCNANGLRQLFTTMGHCNFIEASNMTCGKAAEINSKRLGKDQIEQIEASDPVKQHKEKQKEKPWWRKGKIPGLEPMDKPLDVSKVKDVQKYIETGEK